MIALAKPAPKARRRRPGTAWHAGFLRMLPVIRAYARGAFAHLNPEARQDFVQEAIANALLAYVRLFQLGKVSLAYPTVLARFAIAQVREGRRVGRRLNVRDPLSSYCQRRKHVVVERLDRRDEDTGEWIEAVVEDPHTPPADQAAFRVDFPAWLATHTVRNRRIAESLALNRSTGEVARKFGVSPGRVSQLRAEFKRSWEKFTGEAEDSRAT